MTKLVYDFSEGGRDMKDLLGGKGANLAEMTGLGLPVPPGFVITTEACRAYRASGALPAELSQRSASTCRRSRPGRASGWGTRPTRCSSACGPARSSRCRA
jgi:pyruvate,orthophosphate dikinase